MYVTRQKNELLINLRTGEGNKTVVLDLLLAIKELFDEDEFLRIATMNGDFELVPSNDGYVNLMCDDEVVIESVISVLAGEAMSTAVWGDEKSYRDNGRDIMKAIMHEAELAGGAVQMRVYMPNFK